MFSICIPVYNTDCSLLLDTLKMQINHLNKQIEVIVADDCSTVFTNTNISTCEKHGFKYITNKQNIGRIATRLKLATESNSDYILFVDADMLPKNKSFLKIYLSFQLKSDKIPVFGGYCYNYKKSNNLRLNYGKQREEVNLSMRKKFPYRYVFSGNFLINRDLFLLVSERIPQGYGMDICFSAILKNKGIKISHIENPTIHTGLETNIIFLKKIKNASSNLHLIAETSEIDFSHTKLISFSNFLNRMALTNFLCFLLKIMAPITLYALKRFGRPLLFIDIYRLHCFLNYKK